MSFQAAGASTGEWEELMDGTEEVDVDAVVSAMTVVTTVKRAAHGSDKQPPVVVTAKPTTRMEPAQLEELVLQANAHDRATTQLDSGKLRALGVAHKVSGEARTSIAASPDALPPQTFVQEHAPVSTIQLERGYENALAKKKLVVSESEEDDDSVTMPIQVIHQEMIAALTIPIPRNLVPAAIEAIAHAAAKPPATTMVKTTAPQPWGRGQWMNFGVGIAAGISALVAAAIMFGF